jgi:hypothetical protein
MTQLLEQITDGMNDAQAADLAMLANRIRDTQVLLDHLKREYADRGGPAIDGTIDDAGGFLSREELRELLIEGEPESGKDFDETQIVDAVDRAELLDDDAHTCGEQLDEDPERWDGMS